MRDWGEGLGGVGAETSDWRAHPGVPSGQCLGSAWHCSAQCSSVPQPSCALQCPVHSSSQPLACTPVPVLTHFAKLALSSQCPVALSAPWPRSSLHGRVPSRLCAPVRALPPLRLTHSHASRTTPPSKTIRERQLKYFAHIARHPDDLPHKVCFGSPHIPRKQSHRPLKHRKY